MFSRYYDTLKEYLSPNKVLVIYGPRRVGKTTLLQNFLKSTSLKYRLDSGDNVRVQKVLSSSDFGEIIDYASPYELLAIDEAQNIPSIGQGLKIIVDEVPHIRIIATGSSSFDLSSAIGEPLTGRKRTIMLFPLAQIELNKDMSHFELKEHLDDFLIFGLYPDILNATTRKEKTLLLKELVDSYLLKDILAYERVKGAGVLMNLLRLLAFQVGQLVSLHELSVNLRMDVKTVARYIDILEKSFVIYKLSPYSTNMRKEVTKKCKYYFYDNGIRNGVVSQFQPIEERNDIGALWENFCVMERVKRGHYKEFYGDYYFWRSYGGQEIDLIESVDGLLFPFECKWSKKGKTPPLWQESYPNSPLSFIHRENYLDYLI